MKALLLFILLLPLTLLAETVRFQGQVSVDGEDHKFNEAVTTDKEHSIKLGNYTYKVKLGAAKNNKHSVSFSLYESTQKGPVLVTTGEEMISEKSEDFYLKGQPGQANTIITMKVSGK